MKRAQLQTLKCEFETLKMKEEELVSDYFARTLTIAKKMRTHGEALSETMVVEKIMRTMTKKFNYVVFVFEQANDVEKLFVDELQSSILV